MKTQKTPPAKNKAPKLEMPVDMLKEDHDTVQDLFEQFEKEKKLDRKEKIARTAIEELKVHVSVEEELFYPVVREELGENEEMEELLDEALEEHHVVKFLIRELDEMMPEDDRFSAKFTVLAENVKHHIQEEETEMFPKAKKTRANSEAIAAQMAERKEELQQNLEKMPKAA